MTVSGDCRAVPVCRVDSCRARASVEVPFCRAHWRSLGMVHRHAITRQYRIGYGTGAEAASFQTAVAVRAAQACFSASGSPA
jgi:hypothetical protein